MKPAHHYNEAIKALQRALVEDRTGDLVAAVDALIDVNAHVEAWIVGLAEREDHGAEMQR